MVVEVFCYCLVLLVSVIVPKEDHLLRLLVLLATPFVVSTCYR
jgi:hypothetical protein